MAEIDVRTNQNSVIDKIRVADRNTCDYVGDVLEKGTYEVRLIDSDQDRELIIEDKDHAENLIKGLQKAIDLGWFD